MLPQALNEAGVPARTIYINPNFNKTPSTVTHINPNFLRARTETTPPSTSIHLNPQFLQKKLIEQQQQLMLQQLQLQEQQKLMLAAAKTILPHPSVAAASNVRQPTTNFISHPNTCKLIAKSSMRIVRHPLKNADTSMVHSHQVVAPQGVALSPMIKVGSRKLMRRSLIRADSTSKKLQCNEKPIQTAAVASTSGKYKIDRRRLRSLSLTNASPLIKTKRRSFIGRFALRRTSDFNTKRKFNSSSENTQSTSLKKQFKLSAVSSNKNLQMLNINGVLYKSTRNKLQRKDNITDKTSSATSSQNLKANMLSSPKATGRTLIVRGTRFVLDKHGFQMTRVTDTNLSKQAAAVSMKQRPPHFLKRIDIGGLTYVATSQNVLIRTGNHLARTHLNNAKHKSLQVLSRSLVKSNIPCAIFQRVGKCAAFERGKCRKVHDKRQVAICLRFLRGDCINVNCLLSHNVSLSKMPVCKFYLQGICMRSDCPYLHKKVSQRTEICSDFLRGFCKLADQCDKRHEFLCPDYQKNGKCEKSNCLYCKRKVQQFNKEATVKQEENSLRASPGSDDKSKEEVTANTRYFVSDTDTADKGNNSNKAEEPDTKIIEEDKSEELPLSPCIPTRPKLGALPAYIPLS